jgi:hypothetical protein
MPLKAKVANKVQLNEQGLVEGTITTVLEKDKRYTDAKNNEISKEQFEELKKQKKKPILYSEQFEFHIEVEGTQKNVVCRVWTNQNFNNEMFKKNDDSIDYNSFTRLMLQLEIITESDLVDLSNPKLTDFDVESLEGLKIVFELEPSKQGKGLKVPKLTTIKPVQMTKK